MYPLDDIFRDIEHRETWYNRIIPQINEVDIENRRSLINDFWYAFIPDELKLDHPWKFNVRDIVSDGKDIRLIRALPELDIRDVEDYCYIRVLEHGNTYYTIRIDENGDDLDINDDTSYLHDFFPENKLFKLDPELENHYIEVTKDKKYWFEE